MNSSRSQDAFEIITNLWVGILRREVDANHAMSIAGNPMLAQVATKESTERLAFMIEELANQQDSRIAVFATSGVGETEGSAGIVILSGLVMQHANQLADFNRSEEALLLYDALEEAYAKVGVKELVGECHMNRAIVFRKTGQFSEALRELQEAKSIAEELNIPLFIAKCEMNRANVLLQTGRYQQAIDTYNKAEPIIILCNSQSDLGLINMNRATAYADLGRYPQAEDEYDRAEAIFTEFGMPVEVARCYMNRGNLFGRMGKFDEALKEYDKAEKAFAERGMAAEVAECRLNRATTLIRRTQGKT